jgi:crotonobetainyl-CoA:carnitine CoA-transferase CaiB-like acyl-CoA transferase
MFRDLKVLELASVLAGPSVGQFFAELGAQVIKVENLNAGGDITRTWKGNGEQTDDRSAYFCSVNWGKKSVAIDLNSGAGKAVVHKLAAKSDVVIASYKPGDAQKLGVSYQQLRSNNKQLIYGQITGYGSSNDRVGYDAVIQAESGFMDLNGEITSPPIKMPVALIDVLAAHHLKEGLLIALLKREQSGEGSLVEVSLIQAAVASLVNQASNWLVASNLPTRQGSSHPNIAPYGDSFITRDGKQILLAIGSDRQFFDLVRILDLDQVTLVDRYATNQLRVSNRDALNGILANAINQIESEQLLKDISRHKIPAGVIQNIKDVFEMKEAKELLIGSDGLMGVRSFVGMPMQETTTPLLPPPHFGQHTQEILDQLH